MENDNKYVLEVKDLELHFFNKHGDLPAVNKVSFKIEAGRTLGVVGESGCGKSMTALSVMRLFPSPPGRIMGGEILFKEKDLTKLSEKEMRSIRGKGIAMIFQEPMTSLNPVLTCGRQLTEAILVHEKVSKAEAKKRALEMISMVGIPMPEKIYASCPYQLSGGMRQRVMIAMALSCQPELLICDEPTTALDVTVQAGVLKLVDELRAETGAAVMLITHDMGVISEMAHDVLVMYAGQVVEHAETGELFRRSLHPYTEGLINSIPKLDEEVERLNVIPGNVPMLYELPDGCLFAPRCPYAKGVCKCRRPDLVEAEPGHQVRCFRYTTDWESEE